MTEQRATDWKGPVALVLAGLALLVALSGRGFPFDGSRHMEVRAGAVQVPTAVPPGGLYGMNEPVPMVPGGPELRQELRDKWYQMWGGEVEGAPFHPAKPEPPMPAPHGYYFDSGNSRFDGVWSYVRGAYHYFQPLVQLALIVLLAAILFTWLRRRSRPAYPAGYYPGYPGYNQGYPPPPPAPPPAQGQGSDTPPAGYPGPGVLD
jgi:hypothetical protein